MWGKIVVIAEVCGHAARSAAHSATTDTKELIISMKLGSCVLKCHEE